MDEILQFGVSTSSVGTMIVLYDGARFVAAVIT